jgi:hypothetical protein
MPLYVPNQPKWKNLASHIILPLELVASYNKWRKTTTDMGQEAMIIFVPQGLPYQRLNIGVLDDP